MLAARPLKGNLLVGRTAESPGGRHVCPTRRDIGVTCQLVIAAHGTHEPANSHFSRLELADGGLLAHEVTSLHKPPKQVLLDTCELAVSHVRPTDHPLGFADVLLAAGTQTVIATVTRIGYKAAATTMADYHRDHAAGAAPATALAKQPQPTRCAGHTSAWAPDDRLPQR